MSDAGSALVRASRQSVAWGLNHGTTGNLSIRTAGTFLVTPTGCALADLGVEDLVMIELDGEPLPGTRPSSEWRLHRDLYRARPEAGAVVHTHSRFAVTLACLRMDLPPVHYMIAVTGASTVRCARYALFGTEELSRAAVEAMGTGRACLLANHGLVAIGDTMEQALRVAAEVETVAEYWWRARQAGTPVLLDEREMTAVLERFEHYGR